VLYDNGFNVEDSSSTRLNGVFSMILLVKHDTHFTPEQIGTFFPEDLRPAVSIVETNADDDCDDDSYVISVYGADKPGIIYRIAESLAEYDINIVDLQTQATGTAPNKVYIMVLEVIPPSGSNDEWIAKVRATAAEIKTDVTVRKYETFEL
jgi:glycine cleavage system transcriptional repressor